MKVVMWDVIKFAFLISFMKNENTDGGQIFPFDDFITNIDINVSGLFLIHSRI